MGNRTRQAILLLGIILFAWQGFAEVTASNFTLTGPNNGNVTLSWNVSGSAGGGIFGGWQYMNGTYNVAVSRGTSSSQSASSRTLVGGETSGAYMTQTGNSGHVTDTPPATGQTYYYWLHYAPYSIIDDTANFFFCYLGYSYGTILSSPCIGPISVFVPAPGPEKFTVTFNSNDGKGDTTDQEFEKGISQALMKNGFSRSGYEFQGWSTTENGGVAYEDEQEISIDANLTLYAVWRDLTVVVSFNPNGGEGEMDPQEFDRGVPDDLVKNVFCCTGSVFMGWATNATDEVAYEDEAEITVYEDMTLYAVWASPALKLTPESADWSKGSITLKCEDEDTSGAEHKYSLEYRDTNGNWIAINDSKAKDVPASKGLNEEKVEVLFAELTDVDFSRRLGGIPTVKYKVKDELGRESNECETRHRYALCIGIDNYDTLPEPEGTPDEEGEGEAPVELADDEEEYDGTLSDCATDATGWINKFQSSGGFVAHSLINELATKDNILTSLAERASSVIPGDIFVYTHSSHGMSGALCTYYDDASEDITAHEFATALSSFPAGVGLVVILDACYSGSIPNGSTRSSSSAAKRLMAASVGRNVSFAESVIAEMNVMNASGRRILSSKEAVGKKTLSGNEIGWLTAASASELSSDGIFSQWCLQKAGWENGRADLDGDGKISFLELGNFAVEYLTYVYDDFDMTPQVFSSEILKNICAGDSSGLGSARPINQSPENIRAKIDHTSGYLYYIQVTWNSVPNASFYLVSYESLSDASIQKSFRTEKYTCALGIYKVLQDRPDRTIRRKLREGDSFRIHVRGYNDMYAGPASADVPVTILSWDSTSSVMGEVVRAHVARHWGDDASAPSSPINSDGTINYSNLNIDHDGDGLTSLQECVAGCDPLDPTSTFSATISVNDGNPEVTWSPKLSDEEAAKRKYVIFGKEDLSKGGLSWVDMETVPVKDKGKYRFFKVDVDLR